MITTLLKIPFLKRLITSLSIKILKLLKKNRGYFNIRDINMFLDFLDPIDREIILHQEFENEEFNFLKSQIENNKINYFLDVGANCGYYSIFIAKEVHNINVLSFEPNKEAYLKFIKTLDVNQKLSEKIELKNFGLSDFSTSLEMQSMVKHGYSQTGGSSVIKDKKYKNFDTFFANFKVGDECISFKNSKIAIKIDVEGHEMNVLLGLNNLLQNNKIILQIEIDKNNYILVNELLESLKFRFIFKSQERSNYFYTNS